MPNKQEFNSSRQAQKYRSPEVGTNIGANQTILAESSPCIQNRRQNVSVDICPPPKIIPVSKRRKTAVVDIGNNHCKCKNLNQFFASGYEPKSGKSYNLRSKQRYRSGSSDYKSERGKSNKKTIIASGLLPSHSKSKLATRDKPLRQKKSVGIVLSKSMSHSNIPKSLDNLLKRLNKKNVGRPTKKNKKEMDHLLKMFTFKWTGKYSGRGNLKEASQINVDVPRTKFQERLKLWRREEANKVKRKKWQKMNSKYLPDQFCHSLQKDSQCFHMQQSTITLSSDLEHNISYESVPNSPSNPIASTSGFAADVSKILNGLPSKTVRDLRKEVEESFQNHISIPQTQMPRSQSIIRTASVQNVSKQKQKGTQEDNRSTESKTESRNSKNKNFKAPPNFLQIIKNTFTSFIFPTSSKDTSAHQKNKPN